MITEERRARKKARAAAHNGACRPGRAAGGPPKIIVSKSSPSRHVVLRLEYSEGKPMSILAIETHKSVRDVAEAMRNAQLCGTCQIGRAHV